MTLVGVEGYVGGDGFEDAGEGAEPCFSKDSGGFGDVTSVEEGDDDFGLEDVFGSVGHVKVVDYGQYKVYKFSDGVVKIGASFD